MAMWNGERCCVFVCLCLVVVALMVGPSAQAPAPAPATDCTTVVLGLADCLTYVEGNVSKPASACCKELAPVISGTPQCLCTLFNTTLTSQLGVVINTTLALQLPAACKLTTPPISECAALGFPVPGPVSSVPAVSPPTSLAPVPTSIPPTASAPAPATDCTTVVLGLADCLTYVEGNVSKPASACCTELAPVISGTPQCLCTLFNTTLTSELGIVINTTLALQLPTACKLTTPPISECAALGFPVPGPVSSILPAGISPSSSPARSPGSSVSGVSSSNTNTKAGPSPSPSAASRFSISGVVCAAFLLAASLLV